MASHVCNNFKRGALEGEFDLNATDDIRVLLCDSTTTCDTEQDKATISGYTTLGELAGTGYARQALTSEAVNQDNPNNRAEFDAADATFSSMAADNNDAVGALVYKHVTNDTDSIPICWVEFAASQSFNGGDFTIQWNAEGIFQF